MTEITGGTWEYHPETESVIATVEGDRFDIAQVSMYEDGIDIEATNANGYAIAAIPEMLAALDVIAQAPQHHGAYSAAELLANCCHAAKTAIEIARRCEVTS